MCFVLYAGTHHPIPRKVYDQNIPCISVVDLGEAEQHLRRHFSTPEVQYIGSTAGCGCDFPHYCRLPEFMEPEEIEEDRFNRVGLVDLLRTTGDTQVELLGCWDGSRLDSDSESLERKTISLETLLDPEFFFNMDGGFYTVNITANYSEL